MEETLKSLADLPQLGEVQNTPNQEQNQQQEPKEQRPLSKYAAKQQRRRALTEGPRDKHAQQDRQQRHEVRRSAALADTEKWMAVVRIATALDQISTKVENIENRLNALVLPESDGKDLETLAETTGEALKASANTVVNLLTVKLEEQCQDMRDRQKQLKNDIITLHENGHTHLSDVAADVIDTRDLLRELLRRIGDPADTPLSSRMREVQYIVKKLETPPDDPKENVPQDRKHWLPRWTCQLLFGAEEVHVTDHGVWTTSRVGDQIDFGGTSLLDLWKKIRAARRAYKVQQKIAALMVKLQKQSNPQQ